MARPERLDPSLTQAPEVQLPLGDGQHLSMAIIESRSDNKDQPKSFPLTGLLDLFRRTEALADALAFLYPGAADASAQLSGLLLPQALTAVAQALLHATREVGDLHLEFALYLAETIEAGIDRYLSELTPLAHRVLLYPTLVHVNSVPCCVQFDTLLADLRSEVKLQHQARQWARALPTPAPPAASGAPTPAPGVPTAPTGGRRLPPNFAATHMPLDPHHKDKAPFCLKHLLGKPCDATKCKFSHGPLPANAFSNEAFQALMRGGN